MVLFLNAASVRPSSEEGPHIDSGFIEVEGGRIFYEKVGQGPAIIMIHDGILHRVTWDGQFKALADSYQMIRWDRRGSAIGFTQERSPGTLRDAGPIQLGSGELPAGAAVTCAEGDGQSAFILMNLAW